MDLFESAQHFWMWQMLLFVAVILALLAILNYAAARTAEWQNLPKGSFIEVDGVRLHYSDRGIGRPIVLIHGNLVTGDDYNTSGVAERLLRTCRVILFDRPGYGYSGRPRWRPPRLSARRSPDGRASCAGKTDGSIPLTSYPSRWVGVGTPSV